MVCDKCEKKLGKVITPDPWKSGARNTTEGGGRKIGENKALKSSKLKSASGPVAGPSTSTSRGNPYAAAQQFRSCRICKCKVHQAGSFYCQSCAYQKSICSMCGTRLLSTKNYKQSSV